MLSEAIIIGAALCYPAALPSASHREPVRVRVVELGRMPSSQEPAAWVKVEGHGKLDGIQWLVPQEQLQPVQACEAPVKQAREG